MDDVKKRYDVGALSDSITGVLNKAGLDVNRAREGAATLLEADLMGFSTHGLRLLPPNVEWLDEGKTTTVGDPRTIADVGAIFNWDANFLPGIWLAREAVREAGMRAKKYGIGAGTLHRCQHIACLAAYMPLVLEQGLLCTMMVCTPSEKNTSGLSGSNPVTSINPIAFAAPSGDEPFLFDFSMASTTIGAISRALSLNVELPHPYLRKADGDLTDDPAAFFANSPATITPLGTPWQEHKGFSLALMLELMSSGLSNYGREHIDDGPANVVFIQVIDPDVFGSRQAFEDQLDYIRNDLHRRGVERLPGERAWRLRTEQLENGVDIADRIAEPAKAVAKRLEVPFPDGELI